MEPDAKTTALARIDGMLEQCKSVVQSRLGEFETTFMAKMNRTLDAVMTVDNQRTDEMYADLNRTLDALESQFTQYSDDVSNAMSSRAVQLFIAIREHFLMVGRCMQPLNDDSDDMVVRHGKYDELIVPTADDAHMLFVLSQTALGVMCHELTDHLRKLTRDDMRGVLMAAGFSDVPTSSVFVNEGNLRALHDVSFIGKGRNAKDITFESSTAFRTQARKERRRYHQRFHYFQIPWTRFCRIMQAVDRRMAIENITTDGIVTAASERTLERMARFFVQRPDAALAASGRVDGSETKKRKRPSSSSSSSSTPSKKRKTPAPRTVSAADFIVMRMLLDFGNSLVKVFSNADPSATEGCVPVRPFLRLLEENEPDDAMQCVFCVDRFDSVARALLYSKDKDAGNVFDALSVGLGRRAWSQPSSAVANACLGIKFLDGDLRMTFVNATEKLITCRLAALFKWMSATREQFIENEVDITDNSVFVADYEEIKRTTQQAYKKFFSPRSAVIRSK
jgi:hypothetical protein